MPLPASFSDLLKNPSATAVWRLRAELLADGLGPGHAAFRLLGELHRYLDHLETGGASKDHSERASLMEIGSLSGVVGADLAEAEEPAQWARRLLAATITEGLAVMATRQHVKAWRGELDAVHREAAWFVYEELWRWAVSGKPDLDPDARRELLDGLLAPILDKTVPSGTKQVVLVSLFILLLVDAIDEVAEMD